MSNFIAHFIRIAQAEIGVEEIDGTNCGPRVNEYKAATWKTSIHETNTFKRPRTAGAWDFENWSRAQDTTTWTRKPHRGDIQPGDIVVFRFSHIGIAISAPDKNGNVQTVEGNTDKAGSREGGGVYRKTRAASSIRSRIRFRL